jgi:hypothetical protein
VTGAPLLIEGARATPFVLEVGVCPRDGDVAEGSVDCLRPDTKPTGGFLVALDMTDGNYLWVVGVKMLLSSRNPKHRVQAVFGDKIWACRNNRTTLRLGDGRRRILQISDCATTRTESFASRMLLNYVSFSVVDENKLPSVLDSL